MHRPHISRRSFVRVVAGLFAFMSAAKSLTASPTMAASPVEIKELLKARIAKGSVLALGGDSITILDHYVMDQLKLLITDESMVWKGKYNKGNNFQSYAHVVEPGDRVIARGERTETGFIVEKMFVNHVNMYVTVDSMTLGREEAIISYVDCRSSYPEVSNKTRGVVKVRPDYLIDGSIYHGLVSMRQQLQGRKLQVIGLVLADGAVVASNVFSVT